MKLGDWVKVPDGRIGTIVFSDLAGFGIKWGKLKLLLKDQEVILNSCPLFSGKNSPEIMKFRPDARLRDKRFSSHFRLECVGEDKLCEVIGNGCEIMEEQE